MPQKDIQSQLILIKAMFDNGSVSKMRDIEKLFPTKMAKELGMNHSRYVVKLKKPELFSIKQIIQMASLLNISPDRITEIIFKEVLNTKVKKYK